MDEKKIQRISPSPIALVAKRVKSVEFDGGSAEAMDGASKAQFGINNSVAGKAKGPEQQEALVADLELHLEPEDGENFYSLKLSVSGIFIATQADIGEEEFERHVLTDGMTELYSYARSIAESLTKGGLFGETPLPMLRIEI